MVLAVTFSCATYAQDCVEQETVCDQWWDNAQGKWVPNPTCKWVNRFFLQSTKPTPNPSEGIRVNPNGQPCGMDHYKPCGVKTSTNTCAESTTPFCDPFSDPTCCDPNDPICGMVGAPPPCDPWPCDPYYYDYSVPPVGGPSALSVATRGGHGVDAMLRKAVLSSPLAGSVSTLLQELARASAIYLKATFSLVNPADNTKLTGTYEYWERDGRYRIHLDRSLGYPWTDVAFDGSFFQGEADVDAVEVRRGDDRMTPLPDGPLTLALAPLRLADPNECDLCQLRLADLKQVAELRREAAAKLAPAEGLIRAGVFDAGALRTGEADGENRLARVAWPPNADGSRGIEILLSDYHPIEGTRAVFPMKLTEMVTPETTIEYSVERIDLSPTFENNVFDIHTKARKIMFARVDSNGVWHGHYVRYAPTPGLAKCGAKAAGGEKQ
jgi:hypothetical protein